VSRWAFREAFPWPVRACHWVFAASIVVLAVTGAWIRSPFWLFGLDMAQVRYVHYTFMYVLPIAFAVRVYWAFLGRGSALLPDTRRVGRDFHNFGPQRENKGTLLSTAAYLVFLRRTRPRTAKYNGLEKGGYVFWSLLLLVSVFSGFAIYGLTYSWPVFQWATAMAGGLGPMRDIHYLVMWVFVATSAVHVYLAIAEDLPAARLILTGQETVPDTMSAPPRGRRRDPKAAVEPPPPSAIEWRP
jgi:Ni/Fe-hydrogenase 1 B-type cytochrome subunit